jgi:hypothetical protein
VAGIEIVVDFNIDLVMVRYVTRAGSHPQIALAVSGKCPLMHGRVEAIAAVEHVCWRHVPQVPLTEPTGVQSGAARVPCTGRRGRCADNRIGAVGSAGLVQNGPEYIEIPQAACVRCAVRIRSRTHRIAERVHGRSRWIGAADSRRYLCRIAVCPAFPVPENAVSCAVR